MENRKAARNANSKLGDVVLGKAWSRTKREKQKWMIMAGIHNWKRKRP
jgi:hypothetical protein